ncbi:MAG: DUF882 domain-containing protein [Elusimicrobia bacterium]|nr:DUF882 domain-containing protein [Elusimicrobiota bacterium]
MKTIELRQKTLSALIVLICTPAIMFGRTLPALPEELAINSPDAIGFMNKSGFLTPIPDPKPVPAAAGEQPTDYDFDENVDDQDDPANKPPVRLDGDGHLTLLNNKTSETLSIQYRDSAGNYIPEAAERVRHFFRCRLTGDEHDIAPGLLEILDSLQHKFGNRTITLLSGYRSPELNAALSRKNPGVSKHSLHMSGMAADINIPGVRLTDLRDAARALQARNTGGVGYYPGNGFVHVDTGRVRSWTGKARVVSHKRTKHSHGHSTSGRRTRRAK